MIGKDNINHSHLSMFLPQSIFSRVKHIGISLSPYAVRAIEVDSAGKIIHQVEQISTELLFNGDQVNVPKLTEALTLISQGLGTTNIYAACCFPEKLAYSREHRLPPLSENEITEAVSWQLASIFPIKPEDLYTDWKLIGKTPSETKVVITAVSKQFLDGLVESFRQASIKPVSFESSASALARSLKTVPPHAVIIEIDNFGSSATLVENGVSSLTATTNFSSATDSQTVLTEIVTNIKQLQNRIPAGTGESGTTPLYITGEKAVPELVKIIADQVGESLQNLAANEVTGAFQTAYIESLSTVEAPQSSTSINLLPKELEQQYRLETEVAQARTVAIYSLVISAIAFLVAAALFIVSLILSNSSAQKLAAIPEAPPPSEASLPLLLQKAQKIAQYQPLEFVPQQHLGVIFASVPADALKQYSYDASKKSFKLTLASLSRNQLFDLKTALDESQLFAQISIPLSALNSEGKDNVILELVIKDTP